MTEPRKYRAPALQKGLEILETLAHAAQPMTMSDISAAVSRSRNEIFRMLQVLEDLNYIARNNAGGYVLTNRLFALGMQQPAVRDLVGQALPRMNDLAETLGQSCHLAVASGGEIVVIARVEAPGLLGFAVRVGYRRAFHLSASGQVLMSFQTDRVRDRMLADIDREGDADLIARLDAIRSAGYLVEDSSAITGVHDLSAPVLAHDAAVAALTVPFVGGGNERLPMDAALDALRQTAERISHDVEGSRLA
jgi:DNA-binding IclR family transcriptional regulator